MKPTTISTRNAVIAILGISLLASSFLVWLIYFKPPAVEMSDRVAFLSTVNALFNFLSACCVVQGYRMIRKGQIAKHKRNMLAALIFSALFLVSYVVYHHFHGDTSFLGEGLIRPFYFFILISHILLSIVALPLVLTTAFFALIGVFERHKKLARWTLPIWLYVSVTGVLVYVLLRMTGS